MREIVFYWAGDVEPWARKMLESVETHFSLPVTQMTDMETEALVDRVVRKDYGTPLAESRILHMADYPHDELLMLDCDLIVRKNVEHVFDKEFDIALTRRPSVEPGSWSRMDPFNTGVVFSRSPAFWQDCKEAMKHVNAALKKMGGEQRVINKTAEKAIKGGGYKVLELPGRQYNWSPNTKGYSTGDDVFICHYKGSRKKWMLDGNHN